MHKSILKNQHKGINQRWKYVAQVQQQRPELPTVTSTWHACGYKVHKLRQRYMLKTFQVHLGSLLVFTCGT